MSTPSDAIIENWNRSFRPWSQNYIKPYKSAIIRNCLFENNELQKGHSSALKDIEKNKGNICKFVLENTEQKYSNILPNKILSDTYSFFNNNEKQKDYKLIYKSVLSNYISWKPGTSNALSKSPLEIQYGNNEHFKCKFRKYQLESMKKFIQATPGTKEIRGQWSVNLANDSMMISFGNNDEIIVVIKIGSCQEKLNIMYQENGVLRKNSKIRKQTLKTSCWGLEKTKNSPKFDNSIIIQENYSININADNVLQISPIKVYVKKSQINNLLTNQLKIFCGDICNIVNLNKRPFHIENIQIPQLTHNQEQHLRLKYRNNLLNNTKSGKSSVSSTKTIKSETSLKKTKRQKPCYLQSKRKKIQQLECHPDEDEDDDSDGWNPVKPKRNHNIIIDDNDDNNESDDDCNDDPFYPIKPNHKQHPQNIQRNRMQSLNRINKIIPTGPLSVASMEDTVVTNQEPISRTRHNLQSMDQHSTQSVYTPQTIQPQPPSVTVGYNGNNNGNFNNNNNNFDNQHHNNNNNNFDNSLHFDSTPLIDDGLNWSAFTDNHNGINPNITLSRFQSIGNDINTTFDQQVFNQINDDNGYIADNQNHNAYPPSINHNNNNHNNRNHFLSTFDDDPLNANNGNNNNNNNHGPIISDITNSPQDINLNEMEELRRRNELLLQRVAAQQRQIEFLAQQIGTMHSQTPYPTQSAMDIAQYDEYNQYDQFQEFDQYQHHQQQQRNIHHQRRRNPLKRRRISSEALLPPAA